MLECPFRALSTVASAHTLAKSEKEKNTRVFASVRNYSSLPGPLRKVHLPTPLTCPAPHRRARLLQAEPVEQMG